MIQGGHVQSLSFITYIPLEQTVLFLVFENKIYKLGICSAIL